MNLMRGTINLLKQSLQINRAAGAGRSNHQFHCLSVIATEAEGEVENSLAVFFGLFSRCWESDARTRAHSKSFAKQNSAFRNFARSALGVRGAVAPLFFGLIMHVTWARLDKIGMFNEAFRF